MHSKNKLKIATYSLALALMFPKMISTSSREPIEYIKEMNSDDYNIDNLESYVLQGVCIVNTYIYITAYDGSKEHNNSKIYILNSNKELIREVELYNNSHVGGICYDNKHDIIWITDKKGCISGYNRRDIENAITTVTPIFEKVKVSKNLLNIYGNTSVAYITYFNNEIYLGNYNSKELSKLKRFSVMENGCIEVDSEEEVDFVDYVQGVTFYKKDNKTYLLVSSSYGPFSKSVLKIFKYDEKITNYNEANYSEVLMPRMMEQITTKNDELFAVYESNAKKYKKYGKKANDLKVYDLNTIKRYL